MILRSIFFVCVLAPFTLIALGLQIVLRALKFPYIYAIPRTCCRLACQFIGLRLTVVGAPKTDAPTLLVSNHISWIDIIALGAAADISFVAKSEIADWPIVGFVSKLQRTIFVNRTRRTDAKRTSEEIAKRMASGGSVVLFAEGQSDLGTHVLPFRSALVGAAQAAMMSSGASNVSIQPVTIAYTKMQGMPLSRNERAKLGWAKSKSLKQNIVEILRGSVKEATIAFGNPVPLHKEDDRKIISKRCENEVRAMLVALNRGETLPSIAE